MFASNVDFSGGTPVTGKITTDGQLLIGATASPNIRVGTLSSSDSSITWSVGAGTISGVVAGGSTVGKTITGTTGGALSPTSGNWNILAARVAAGVTPISTSGSVSTLTINVQTAQAIASTDATKVGLANFDSARFTVDANGFVSANGSGLAQTITGTTGGSLSPTSGNWNILGASTAAGTTPVSTSGSVSSLTVNVQKSQAIASTDATKVGVCNFDSARFSVDANGFVSASATGLGQTITGNSGGSLSPTSGNWNVIGSGSITIAGSGSTETVQLTGLTNHSLLVGAGTATITNLGVATNGQLPIGSTGADPTLATLTASTGISVTNGAGSITLASTGSGMAWVDVTGTTQAMAVDTGYAANNAGLVTLTLPVTSAAGSVIEVYYKGAGGWSIAQNASQQIRVGNVISSAGVGGSVASTAAGDCIRIRCITANTLWESLGSSGALTVT